MTSPIDRSELLSAAASAGKQAYAPYSKFQVGAAIITKSGQVYSGCNIENVSYGLTTCAERVAVFKALSEGDRDLVALAICSSGAAFPCGACRQVLHEFAPELRIFLGDSEGHFAEEKSLKDLLPHAFGSSSLEF